MYFLVPESADIFEAATTGDVGDDLVDPELLEHFAAEVPMVELEDHPQFPEDFEDVLDLFNVSDDEFEDIGNLNGLIDDADGPPSDEEVDVEDAGSSSDEELEDLGRFWLRVAPEDAERILQNFNVSDFEEEEED